MQKQIRRTALALVLASALFADAQTTIKFVASEQWRNTKAYEKLGARLITPEEIMSAGLETYTPEQIKQLFEKLPSPGRFDFLGKMALKAMRDHGYVLIPVSPSEVSTSTDGWLSVRMFPIPDSFRENWEEQEKRARGTKRVPTVEELTRFARVLWAVRGELPFETVYVRTANASLDGSSHVCLGGNEGGVLKIRACADSFRSDELGLAPVARKP